MNIQDSEKNGINSRAIPDIERDGFCVERFWGQTHVYLPPESKLGVKRDELVGLVRKTFGGYDLSSCFVYFHPDCVSMSLPSVRRGPYPLVPSEDQRRKMDELFEKDPRKVFPDWFLPEELAKRIVGN